MKKNWTPFLNVRRNHAPRMMQHWRIPQWMTLESPALCFALGIVVFVVFLNGCSWLRNPDVAQDSVAMPRSPASTDTLREACIRACNHDHDTCNEGPASRAEVFDAPQQILGAGAACDKSMRNCLKSCR